MRYLSYILLLLMVPLQLSGQVNPGARQIALSHSDLAQSNDVFSLFNNSAGLAQLNWREAGVYYSPAPFGLTELANGFAAYHEPASFGSIGIGLSTYGFELYRETQISLAFSRLITEQLFAGVTVNYKSLSIKNYGSDGIITLNLGSLFYITQTLRIGFVLQNFTRSSYGDEKEQAPIIYATGLSYDALDNLTMNISIENEHDRDLSLRSGIEYGVMEYIDLRFGFSNYPVSYSTGIGINYSIFQLDYALFTHQDLGLTHQAGIIVHFGFEGSRSKAIKSYLFE